ncbi:MAG: AbrB/MazE/SpoVT family DNA-binding domain-containing protein [Gammaproteobacteria bacterium]|nr:AbrB/MazE/SpoVT family DNA-binding domain-containing protein [Gammaproteobacteria bacterium]
MDAIRKIRNRNGSLVVAIPSGAVRACHTMRSPCVVLLPADGALLIRAHDPGFMPGPGDRASVRRVQSSRGTYFVTIPAGLVRAMGLEAGQYLTFAVDGDQIRAGRADVRQVSCAGAY